MMIQVNCKTGIVHARCAGSIGLTQFLHQLDLSTLNLQQSEQTILSWLSFGAVYVNGRRTQQDTSLQPLDLVRLHTRPKRFPVSQLSSRILLIEKDFIILDKPPGLPTHATLDNSVENVLSLLEREQGEKYYVTHRLDVQTQGLLILAKSPAAQSELNKLFAARSISKTYRALTSRPVKRSQYVHYMNPTKYAPKVLSDKSHPKWLRCILEVTGCSTFGSYFGLDILLGTGRTHQIRAQLAILSAPILGDYEYGSDQSWPVGIALESYSLSFKFGASEFDICRQESLFKKIEAAP